MCDYSPSSAFFMEAAAFLPAPMARMTVAAPVTMSPPAHTLGLDVRPSSSASMRPQRLSSTSAQSLATVSYTHLTLPTNSLV